jgi:hypothetical protein
MSDGGEGETSAAWRRFSRAGVAVKSWRRSDSARWNMLPLPRGRRPLHDERLCDGQGPYDRTASFNWRRMGGEIVC